MWGEIVSMSDNDAAFGINGEPIERETDTAKCPACGAKMVFSPEKQQLECPYCGCTQEVNFTKTSSEIALEYMFAQKNDEWGQETHVFRCNNCGAKEVIRSTEISKACPFCGTTNVTQASDLSGMRPNGVVPFAIDVKAASDRVVAWAKKKFFAPRAFKKSVKPEKLTGLYVPAFTFDANTFSTYQGRLGKYYSRTVRSGGKTKTVRELRYFTVSGNLNLRFDDVLVQAGERITQRDLDKLSPFDTNASKEYSSEYLHGYSAQGNEKSGEQCWEEAKGMICEAVKQRILSQYDYDVVDYLTPQTSCSDVTFKYVLLPLYVGHCNFKQKLYNFFVNGKNGNVTGKTPVSALKVTIAVLLGVLIIGGFFFLCNYYL